MSKEGKLVCQGAECMCQNGDAPDKLIVETQSKRYINDPDRTDKLMATNKEIGQPFEKKTFGQCKLQPTIMGFKPCQPNITEWTDFYDKITVSDNQGNPLLEGSKATCAIAGSPCVSILFHGQTTTLIAQNFEQEEKEEDTTSQINPLVSSSEIKQTFDKPELQAKKISLCQ